jgi:predicted PurR-regulated permease PerM
VLIGLALLGTILLASLVYPFASTLLFAAVLAGAVYPQCERLAARLGRRPMLASGLVTVGVGVLLAVPTVWLALTVGSQVLTGVNSIEGTLRKGGGIPALIERLPPSMRQRAQSLSERLGGTDQIQDMAEDQAGKAAAAAPAAIVAASTIVIKVALMLVALFFFLIDGKRLVHWFATVAPLPEEQILGILLDFRTVSVAVLFSSLGTAGAQALAAFVTLKEGAGAIAQSKQLIDELKEHVVKKIGAIARPDDILFTADLPKTRSGKIMRRLLRDIAEGKTLGDTTTLADPAVVAKLKVDYEDRE